jgi:hypothetical protein
MPPPSSFTSSEAKDFIRDQFDFEILRGFRREYYPDQQLAYFGLPGEQLLDILSWRSLIGRWTAVQINNSPEDQEVASRLVRNVMLNHLDRGFDPVWANIDELLTDPVQCSELGWPYQIINLDYYGGLVNAAGDERSSRRMEAIRAMFERQVGSAFVLFLTINLRDRDRGVLADQFKQEEEDLLALEVRGVSEVFAAHRELGNAGMLKIIVPVFLAGAALRHNLICQSPVLYQGTQQMIHFAVQCTPYREGGAGRVLRTRDRIDIINLPLLVLHGREDLREVRLGEIPPPRYED